MNSWPISRSRGPSMTELRRFSGAVCFCGSSAPGEIEALAAGRLLLTVSHTDVPVEAGTVLDLQPAYDDVAAQPRVLAERQLVPRRDRAFEVSLHCHVRSFDQRSGGR